MRWRRWRDDEPRPKRPSVTKLDKDQLAEQAGKLNAAFGRSPVLAGLGVRVRTERGRFYVERVYSGAAVLWGRITPVVQDGPLLLECEGRSNSWYQVARGGLAKVVKVIARDTRGTFHGLGALDAALRAAKQGLTRRDVRPADKGFVYAETQQACTAQEVLLHYFALPLSVLIEPRIWYARHRRPYIVEYAPDRSRVLVYFCSSSFSGDPIRGACLYVRHAIDESPRDDPQAPDLPNWAAYTIRPNADDSIASAEQWLVKRKWQPWT